MTSYRAIGVYVAFVALFYWQTNGFTNNHDWKYCILKTLPCVSLAGLVYGHRTPLADDQAALHAVGLLFGALGDFVIALSDNILFVGAMAFAVGHIFYMAQFARNMKQVSKELALIVLVYGAIMNHFFLMPSFFAAPLKTLTLIVYSLILCTALVLSGSLYFHGTANKAPKQKGDLIRFLGYALFLFSDSLLLLCYVGRPIPYNHLAVLSTYFTAQYMILMGASHGQFV